MTRVPVHRKGSLSVMKNIFGHLLDKRAMHSPFRKLFPMEIVWMLMLVWLDRASASTGSSLVRAQLVTAVRQPYSKKGRGNYLLEPTALRHFLEDLRFTCAVNQVQIADVFRNPIDDASVYMYADTIIAARDNEHIAALQLYGMRR